MDQVLFKLEIISKILKWGEVIKNLLLEIHWARKTQIYMKVS
jgi:hypothetical protein